MTLFCIKKSTLIYKQRKFIKEFDKCSKCNGIFNKYDLEIEHTIPLCIGGDIKDFTIMCKSCHKNKTKNDLTYISFLKKIGLLLKVGQFEYELDRNKCLEVYKYIFRTGRTTRTGKSL